MTEYDLVVIGAGPGGYVAAIRASQLGMKVAVVERDEIGGICLNWGCIPSKALLRNAEVLSLFRRAHEFGIAVDGLQPDFGQAIDRSRDIVRRLTRGVSSLLRRNQIDVIQGNGHLDSHGVVGVSPDGRKLTGKYIILATGARPRQLPQLAIDGDMIVTSREALNQRQLPKSVVIVGGGSVGVEFASVYQAYGVQVALVEMLPNLLPNEDEEISQGLENALGKLGIKIYTNSEVTTFDKKPEPHVTIKGRDGEKEIPCDRILVAVGIQPNTEGLGLEQAGILDDKGFIAIDDQMATSTPGIYAIGDVTGKLALAHVGMAQGIIAAERIAGLDVTPLRYQDMPRATYSLPQVSSLGLTEREARDRGYDVEVGRFPFRANGKALALGQPEGMVKVIANTRSGEILGVHLLGSEVTELAGEAGLAHLLKATSNDLGWLVHPHPSLSEAVKEAALDVNGRAIHI